ncbi:Ig-like domain-containing protein, partial [Anaeromyxobacter sp. PSR-1]|uniref:Ig-like domain-containing protein n=2 Tax=unclassified Anaeromyxobacter TaxID=2620896 RepID=UPI000B1AFD45
MIRTNRLAGLVLAALAVAACSRSSPARPAAARTDAIAALPPDASFRAFLCAGEGQGDVAGDAETGLATRDIVGDATHPAFYRAADAANVYFRMRVSGDPRKPGSTTLLQPSSWDVLVDTDGDLDTYEFMLTADGNIDSTTHVQWLANTVKDPTNPRDPADALIQDFTPAGDYWAVRETGDGSRFGGDPDWFITLRIPKATLAAAGLDLTQDFVVWGGTNAQTYSLNADFGCYVGIPANLGDATNDPGDLDPPDALDDAAATPEDAPVGIPVLANDTGIEADTAVAIASPPAHGTAAVQADRTVTYAPAADWFGTDTFVYQVADAGGETDTAVVIVTVTAVDDGPPVAVDDDRTVIEGTPSPLDVLANDTVTDRVGALAVLAPPAHGTTSLNPDRTITYAPEPGYEGPDQLVYQVTDGDGQTASATVRITVQPADSGAPVAVADAVSTAEDVALPVIAVLANDTVADLPSVVTLATAPAQGTATVNPDGSLAYAPAPDWSGTEVFTYRVADREGQIATATVTITVTAVDDGPPVAAPDTATTP